MEKPSLFSAFEVRFSSPEILYLLELVQSDVSSCQKYGQKYGVPEDRLSLRDRQEVERKLREAWSAYPQPYGLFYLHLRAAVSYSASLRGADDHPAEPGE